MAREFQTVRSKMKKRVCMKGRSGEHPRDEFDSDEWHGGCSACHIKNEHTRQVTCLEFYKSRPFCYIL